MDECISSRHRRQIVKHVVFILMLGLMFAGCATRSTIATRKQERISSYIALPQEQREAVDVGQIKVGMTEEAVYIAWGSPSQILRGESSAGSTMTWIYMGQWMEETRFWSRRGYITRDYFPRSYVSSEVIFQNGKVVRWQTMPRPGY
jgi:hypothetical protein